MQQRREAPKALMSVGMGLLLVFALTHSVAAQTCVPPPAGLVSWWTGDVDATDIANGNNGTLTNGALTGAAGKVGGTFQFDGVDDFVEATVANLPLGSAPRTIELWFKTTPSTAFSPALFGYGVGPSPYDSTYLVIIANKLCIGRYNGGDTCGAVTVTDNVWHHAALTYDSVNKMQLYLDGQLEASRMENYATSASTFRIGVLANLTATSFEGSIDEVTIFDRALSAAEIQSIFNAGSAGKCKGVTYSCVGFEPPVNNGPVTVKGNRALPLKAQLFDESGNLVTATTVSAAPVLQVLFDSGMGGEPIDVTDAALPAGQGTDGNQFIYNDTDEKWQFNLKTKNYTAAGTYTITMLSGDETEYTIDPLCVATFVRE